MTACHIKIQEAVGYDALWMRTELFSFNYAANGGNFLPTFQDHLSVPSSRAQEPKKKMMLCRLVNSY